MTCHEMRGCALRIVNMDIIINTTFDQCLSCFWDMDTLPRGIVGSF